MKRIFQRVRRFNRNFETIGGISARTIGKFGIGLSIVGAIGTTISLYCTWTLQKEFETTTKFIIDNLDQFHDQAIFAARKCLDHPDNLPDLQKTIGLDDRELSKVKIATSDNNQDHLYIHSMNLSVAPVICNFAEQNDEPRLLQCERWRSVRKNMIHFWIPFTVEGDLYSIKIVMTSIQPKSSLPFFYITQISLTNPILVCIVALIS